MGLPAELPMSPKGPQSRRLRLSTLRCWTRSIGVVLVLAGSVCPPSTAEQTDKPRATEKRKTKGREAQSIKLSMERVVERRMQELTKAVAGRRVAWRRGPVGLGVYLPAAAGLGWGLKVPPPYLFPSAALGGSLNVDPITGRSYFDP